MKKNYKPKDSTNQKLTAYSALAGVFVAAGVPVDAAVVYTDVNPDSTVAGGTYSTDFNNDGITEFTIFQSTYGGIKAVGIYSEAQGAGFVGYTGYGYYYASKLNANLTVSSGNNFITAPAFATMAYVGAANYGAWVGAVDGFLGLRFVDANTDTFYAWIRLDVANDASSFTIKDYAYENTAGTAITTGGAVGIDRQDLSAIGISAYSYGKNIYVKSDEAMNGTLTVLNTAGQVVYETVPNDSFAQIQLDNAAAGIYFVEYIWDNKAYRKKLYLGE